MLLEDLFRRKQKGNLPGANECADRGIMVFDHTGDVIQAEDILRKGGWEVRVMGPPPEIRTGCDLVIEFPLIEELNILRVLENERIIPIGIVPVTGPLLQPVNLFHTKDFGDYIMVRAANMKLTVEKKTGIIVNISGGGCPDVPFLASRMVGRNLNEAPSPRSIGHTLCGYALQLAYEEVQRRCSE
ncbi:MAG: DUF3343 domain-containing protein [Syntrophales bacterium]|jgi:hypothetical protein|nr:DUF3343 domain-containing protein [Syntrophales bacterium]MDY0043186.1 DUF3343 domain-containing protein [Syntrophales bacterium]